MRDLINILDGILLSEEKLAANQMPPRKLSSVKNPDTGQIMTRQELFLYKVKNKSPFEKPTGEKVTIDPVEEKNVADWLKNGMRQPITLKIIGGGTVKNTELQKTVEFGSKEAEQIKIKGSDIFGTDAEDDAEINDLGNKIETILSAGGFPVIEMYDVLAKSPQIKSLGNIGKAILSMAKQITEGKVPVFPSNLTPQEIKAIELYASEYLGVLGLAARTVPFKQGNRDEFDNFLGMDMGELIVYFPKSVSNPLADSFTISNDQTGHAIKISSKAAGKGAPPSLTSLKLPDDIRQKYPEAAAFLDSAQDPSVSTYGQPFKMMNAMAEVNPKAVPAEYKPLLPFSDSLISELEATVKSNKKISQKIMDVFNQRLSEKVKNSENTDGGKAWYAVTTDIIDLVNKGSTVPNLREALIESLGYNFVQLYSNVKGNKLVTEAFWPAKLRGNVKLKTKGSAAEPKKGKLSVEISPGKEKADVAVGSSLKTGAAAPTAGKNKSKDGKIDKKITDIFRTDKDTDSGEIDTKGAGRKRRRPG